MSIIAHNFNGINIDQLAEDSTICGKKIPAGYVNLTGMCKGSKKSIADWYRVKASTPYLQALSADMGIPISEQDALIENENSEVGIPTSLLIELKGGNAADRQVQGTWGHFEIGIEVARWLSPTFAVWANRTLRLVIDGEFDPLSDRAKEAKAILEKELEDLAVLTRRKGKLARRTMTDAIRDYAVEKKLSKAQSEFLYTSLSDSINVALFGKKALQLCAERGCDRNKLRDTHSVQSLKDIDQIESAVARKIDKGLEPIAAMAAVLEFLEYN